MDVNKAEKLLRKAGGAGSAFDESINAFREFMPLVSQDPNLSLDRAGQIRGTWEGGEGNVVLTFTGNGIQFSYRHGSLDATGFGDARRAADIIKNHAR